jgi:hypothetical protein
MNHTTETKSPLAVRWSLLWAESKRTYFCKSTYSLEFQIFKNSQQMSSTVWRGVLFIPYRKLPYT